MSQAHAIPPPPMAEDAPSSGCFYCIAGDPTGFVNGQPACEKCHDAIGEVHALLETIPCGEPEFL